MNNLPQRKNIRLNDYDYSQNGAYFITICSYNREHIFGRIDVGQGLCSCRNVLPVCNLSEIGTIVFQQMYELQNRYTDIEIDKFVVMPNHIHVIIFIKRQEQSPCPTIGDIICAYKSITTKMCNKKDNNTNGRKIWQFRFHDHIIRNEAEYQKIWEYIDTNHLKWQNDCYYSDVTV